MNSRKKAQKAQKKQTQKPAMNKTIPYKSHSLFSKTATLV